MQVVWKSQVRDYLGAVRRFLRTKVAGRDEQERSATAAGQSREPDLLDTK